MNYLKHKKNLKKVVKYIDNIFSLFILLTIIGVVLFTGIKIIDLYQSLTQFKASDVLHTVALVIILVKAYRVLLFYMESHHISVLYIVEISIIASALEIIFLPDGRDIWLTILFALFGMANLLIYVFFHEKLEKLDEKLVESDDPHTCLDDEIVEEK